MVIQDGTLADSEERFMTDAAVYPNIKYVVRPVHLDSTLTGAKPRMRHNPGCGHFKGPTTPRITVITLVRMSGRIAFVKPWEQYQHRTADLLRELGFAAAVNDPLAAPNGVIHKVDVSARIVLAGVDVLWIVECKLWKRRVPKEKVSALKDIVNDLAADRGLLMSEKGFQSGAVHLAAAKNITLSSLDEVRVNASEQLIASRVMAAKLRLLGLIRRITRDLRTFGPVVPHLLPALAARLTEADRAELARRPDAAEFREAIGDMASRLGDVGIRDLAPSGLEPLGLQRMWRSGVDTSGAAETASTIGHLIQAVNQGRLGDWPVLFKAPGEPKLAWSMPQLLGVVEPSLTLLEERVAEQEARAQ
jgi:Restriction endonuclease